MVTSDIEKKTVVIAMIIASAIRCARRNSPETRPLASSTTGRRGIIQLKDCTILGKEVRGKKTPLKKNIGVMNRV